MKQKFLSLLLAAVLAVTSVDMTVFAVEAECEEDVRVQEENSEIDKEIKVVETAEATEADKGTEAGEGVEPETIVEIGEEPLSEHNHDENTNQVPTELLEESVEGNESQETMEIQETTDIAESHYDDAPEETQFQESETEEEIKSSVEEESGEEIQTEEMIVGSSAELNTAMKNKILSLKSKYPEGKNWDPSGNGWNNRAWECLGFVITIEGQLFKDYPVNTNTGLRKASNGHVEEGWTCYYVTDKNYNSLVVEPGDILDCPTSTQWNHTAMVLSVDNGKITCVQANNSTDKRGKNLVYWTQCFNYSTNRSTLKNIYNDYSKYITGSGSKVFRLWKPSEALKKQAAGYSETPVASTLKITGQSSPGNIKTGERWTCTGTISSNYAITHVGGYILQSDHSTVAQSKTIKPNATSYSLPNGEIDRALLFNELPQGTYYYKITAHDASGMRLTLIDDKFTVTSPAPKPCNFSGQITSPVEWAALNTSKVNITALATDAYAINNFIITLYFNGNNIRTETIPASKSGTTYTCDYDFNLSEEGGYAVNVTAACANGATHSIGDRFFTYDTTPPIISNLRAYEENGDFYCSANVSDSVTGVANAAIVIRDEGGTEKSFECRKVDDIVLGIWSDISGLWSSGKYTIILYVQDNAGNVGHAALQDVVIAEMSSGPQRVDIVVGEEKEVNISVNTLFKTEGKNGTQKTDTGMKAVIKGTQPGCSKFRFEWIAKNNAFTTEQNYDILVYTVPQSPKITKLSSKMEGYDVITYEPVAYAKTYELYRKRIGIDADYIPYEEFTDNKSHSIVVEHADKGITCYYRICAKAEEVIDAATNEKYYPISALSNELHSEEKGETEESGTIEESSTTEVESSPDNGDITNGLYISGLYNVPYKVDTAS